MGTDFRCELKIYRVTQGLTQEQLAEKVGGTARNNHAAGKGAAQPLSQAGYRDFKSRKGPHRGYFYLRTGR